MANQVNINPRYLPYSKEKVQELLEEMDSTTVSTEESVREIVSNYTDENDNGE